MKLLLIGHGYLGQAITQLFRENGWDVIPVSLTGGDGVMACDVSQAEMLGHLPEVDFIVHCASSSRLGGVLGYQRVYVDGCRNLKRRYPEVPMLFTSSTSVYGQISGEIVTEESMVDPHRERGELLLKAEHMVKDAGGIVARLSGIYGPGRSVLLKKFLSGEAVVEGDGSRYLNHIHRDDAAEAVYQMVTQRWKGVFNVSDSVPLHQIDCYAGLARLFKKPMPPTGPINLERTRGWTNKRVSNAKLRALGWMPRYPSILEAAESIAKTLV